jgi:hypothetical protein
MKNGEVLRQNPVPIPTQEEMAQGRYEAMVFAHDALGEARHWLLIEGLGGTARRCLDAINRIRKSLGQEEVKR